ncbi:hypothetical protein ACOMHN_057813 [Nucella lapillus]
MEMEATVKLEKEKVRIEKERQRAMERQAKLERMKGRLSQADTDAASPSSSTQLLPPVSGSPPPAGGGGGPAPPPGPLPAPAAAQDMSQYKVTADFKRKLEEWEQMKTSLPLPDPTTSTSTPSPSPEVLTPSPQPSTSPPVFTLEPSTTITTTAMMTTGLGERPSTGGEEGGVVGGKPPPLTLQPYSLDTPEERSPVDKASDVSYGDDSTSVTEESCTRSNVTSLERANSELLREVTRKEAEYGMLQEEVHKLNTKLDKVRQEHAAEMARFHRELEAGAVAGPVQLEVGELESTVRELEEKIALMENAGDELAESMETAAIGKWQSVEGEEAVSQQLVDMVDQMKDMLLHAARSRELTQKTMALHNFEKVYCHAMKLQVQMNNLRMNNLRVSQLERNKEIMLIKRQLLLQEVNNVLLQAHITRRETELYQYREARRQGGAVRRWNTFSGQGDNETRPPLLRNVSLHDNDDPLRPSSSSSPPPPPSAPSSSITTSTTKTSAKHDNIPCITDEDASIPAARIAEGAGEEERVPPPPSPAFPSLITTTTTTAPTPEKSTDHQEHHLATTVTATTTTPTTPIPITQATSPDSGSPPVSMTTSTRTVEQGETRVSSPSVGASAGHAGGSTPPARQTTPPLPSSSMEKAAPRTPPQPSPSSSPPPPSSSSPPPPPPSSSSSSSSWAATSSSSATTTTTTTIPAASGVSRAEKGSPGLLALTSPADSPQAGPMAPAGLTTSRPETETPAQPIPERPDPRVEQCASPARSVASPDDDEYSHSESVMECTKPVPDASPGSSRGPPSSPGPLPVPPRPPEAAAGASDSASQGPPPKAVRSPVSRHKYLRRQKEERDKRRDTPSSPKCPRSGESGKPPLPRQSTPHQSPSTTHRSKSVGDMEGCQPDSTQAAAPLRDVIQKFEKRATVCETEERKIEFRKTPSPTLHLPRVGLVSRVRRLKPAAELLQESQRYRSGHSIYATRIMQRYLPGKSPQSGAAVTSPVGSQQDKENVSGSSSSYVQAIVRKLSRENTPVKSAGSSNASSSLSLHRTDSPGRTHSDLVTSLVHKLSSSSGPADGHKSSSPLLPFKDLTNEGRVKKLTHAFAAEDPHGPSVTEPDPASPDRTRAAGDLPLPPASVTGGPAFPAKPDSTVSPSSHLSMPALASDQPQPTEDNARERAATYCVSEGDRPRQQQSRGPDDSGQSIEHIAEEFLDPALLSIRERKGQKISPSSSTNSKNALCCQSSACTKSKSSYSSSSPQSAREAKPPSSPKTPERRGGREKMETIGALCKQSMSFDLGVSLRAQSPEATPQRPQSAESLRTAPGVGAGEGEGAKARPSSTSSEGEVAASSEEKKKSRARFLDSSWLQKPKKFFKVSK